MSENPYIAPTSELEMASAHPNAIGTEFYVVSIKKFLWLFVATFGIYALYWHYKQWEQYRRFHNEKMWPIARAIFAIFFIHKLTRNIDDCLRDNKTPYDWSPSAIATAYVVLSLVSNASNKIPDNVSPWLDLLPLVILAALAWLLMKVQHGANLACAQPDGESNARFTAANWVWLVLGAIFWLFFLVGIVLLIVKPESA